MLRPPMSVRPRALSRAIRKHISSASASRRRSGLSSPIRLIASMYSRTVVWSSVISLWNSPMSHSRLSWSGALVAPGFLDLVQPAHAVQVGVHLAGLDVASGLFDDAVLVRADIVVVLIAFVGQGRVGRGMRGFVLFHGVGLHG